MLTLENFSEDFLTKSRSDD